MIKASSIFQRRPHVYGLLYLSLIPIYATFYYFFPSITGPERSYIECLYFSTVTITTLGYGDITPLDEIGQLVTASESLLGVISIGLFLNAIASARSDTVREEQAKRDTTIYRESQKARLNGHYSLIHPIVERYRHAVIDVTRPRDSEPREYNPDFKLNDMKDLYKPTSLLRERYLRPAVFGYFEVIETLHKEISDLIKNVDLRCFPSIESHSLQLVSTITSFDHSGAILSAPETMAGDKKLSDFASEMLENYKGNCVPEGSNILNGYILLYHQIKIVMQVLSQLENEVQNEILSSTSANNGNATPPANC